MSVLDESEKVNFWISVANHAHIPSVFVSNVIFICSSDQSLLTGEVWFQQGGVRVVKNGDLLTSFD